VSAANPAPADDGRLHCPRCGEPIGIHEDRDTRDRPRYRLECRYPCRWHTRRCATEKEALQAGGFR